MKKTFFYLISFLLLSVCVSKAQTMEGPEFESRTQTPLGTSNGSLYYYNFEVFKKGYKITVYKYNAETLAETSKGELVIPQVEGFKSWNLPVVVAKIIDGKFYFFYAVFGKDFKMPIYLTTCNADLTNARHIETGTLIQNANWNTVNYSVNFSPDNKTALIVIKNYCDKMKLKMTGINTAGYSAGTICEDVTLVYFDLVNYTVKATKTLPVEMNGLKLKTRQHQIDNTDNVSFIASIAKEKVITNTIEATSTATLLKDEKNVNISEINIDNTKKISSYLLQLKNGDVAYLGMLDTKVIFRLIPSGKKEKSIETTFLRTKLTANPNNASFYSFKETEAGYYLCLDHGHSDYSVAFINKTGELLWHKIIPGIRKVYTVTEYVDYLPYTFVNDNKLNFVFLENKPYEETKKTLKALNDSVFISQYDYKNFNTTLVTIDELGKTKKDVINDNGVSYAGPNNIIYDKNFMFLQLSTRVKSVPLK